MSIIEELKIQNIAIDDSKFRALCRVKAGNYFMSLQGSCGHYSHPKETTDLDSYTAFELALFDSDGKWVNIRKDEFIGEFFRYNQLLKISDGWTGNSEVFAYAPVDLLNDLYLYLNSLNK
jgi:hypothetical protein